MQRSGNECYFSPSFDCCSLINSILVVSDFLSFHNAVMVNGTVGFNYSQSHFALVLVHCWLCCLLPLGVCSNGLDTGS